MLLIGARILEYRKAANMSQEEFALKIGVSRQAVSKWELDKAYPDLDKLVDICEIFHISIDELLYGKKILAAEEPERQNRTEEENTDEDKKQVVENINTISAGEQRGKFRKLRLTVCAILSGMLFLFCCTVFITVFLQNAWNKDSEHIASARIERVYQQYTKADICFSDNENRKVLKTVWLDEDGIRDGDYVKCYTDEEQKKIYIDYYVSALVVPAVFMLLFLCLLILLCMEIHRVQKENEWHILLEDKKEEESETNNA